MGEEQDRTNSPPAREGPVRWTVPHAAAAILKVDRTRTHDAGALAEGWRGDVLELVQKGAMQSAVWAIAFKETHQAESFANSIPSCSARRTA